MSILEKGSVENIFEKSSQPEGSHVFYIGAAWDGDVDLDLVIVPLRGDAPASDDDIVYYGRLQNFGDAIKHSGDARDGDAEGDDESVVIKCDALPPEITAIAVGVIAYNVDDMSAAKNTAFRICDGDNGNASVLYDLPMSDDDVEGETVLYACALQRTSDGFTVKNVGKFYTEFAKGAAAVKGLMSVAGSEL